MFTLMCVFVLVSVFLVMFMFHVVRVQMEDAYTVAVDEAEEKAEDYAWARAHPIGSRSAALRTVTKKWMRRTTNAAWACRCTGGRAGCDSSCLHVTGTALRERTQRLMHLDPVRYERVRPTVRVDDAVVIAEFAAHEAGIGDGVVRS